MSIANDDVFVLPALLGLADDRFVAVASGQLVGVSLSVASPISGSGLAGNPLTLDLSGTPILTLGSSTVASSIVFPSRHIGNGTNIISAFDNGPFNGTYDPMIFIGYNHTATAGIVTPGESAAMFGIEGNYNDGSGENKIEMYFQLEGLPGQTGFYRPYFTQANRLTGYYTNHFSADLTQIFNHDASIKIAEFYPTQIILYKNSYIVGGQNSGLSIRDVMSSFSANLLITHNWGANGYPGILTTTTSPLTFGTGGVEQMRLTTGCLGLGTTTPTARSHSYVSDGSIVAIRGTQVSSAERVLLLERTISGTGSLGVDFSSGRTNFRSKNDIVFSYGSDSVGTEAMRISASSGSVGIGTDPGATLDVNGATILRGNITFSPNNTYNIGGGIGVLSPKQIWASQDISAPTIYADEFYPKVSTANLYLKSFANHHVLLLPGAGGKVGVGLTEPTAVCHLKAGTATASTAPLKLTPTGAVLLTVPELGAIETDLTNIYYTRVSAREIIPTVITKIDTGDPTGAEGVLCINTYDNNVKIYAEGSWRQLASW
jgi:hypothetical protein